MIEDRMPDMTKIYDTNLDQIRTKMKRLGLKENSVKEAIQWARKK